MASLLIKNCRFHNAWRADQVESVLIRDGIITGVGKAPSGIHADQVIDAGGRTVAPGFIDVHIQGAGGADVLDATPEALETISRTCVRFGVTSFLATTVYKPGQDNDHLKVVAKCAGREFDGADMLGVHLEGPFIASERRGMIQPDCLGEASPAILDEIYGLLGDGLKMMTVAPELPGAAKIVQTLVERGTVASFGHSKATYEEAIRGFDMGINHVTHLFNAMPSLYHREPGPLGAIFERPEVTCQVITDGVHSHPAVLRLAFKALGPERFVTITDGIQAMGLPDGKYVYNDIEYESKDGAARYKDGTLIGTALGLSQLLTRLARATQCSVSNAIKTVTENPAQVLGIEKKKGKIMPQYDADIVILEQDMSIWMTIAAGRIVYRQKGEA